MPMYTYVCDECKKEADIIRSMSESDLPLLDEDFGTHKLECESIPKKYTKIIKGAPQKAYAPGWGYRKGYGYRGSDW